MLLLGTAASEKLNGSAADEYVLGLEGNDKLYGNAGNDLLEGGAGRDTLTGGEGADTFRFSSRLDSYRTSTTAYTDNITDFDGSQDCIDLTGLAFTGLGNGYNGTLKVSYNGTSDRTYLKSYEADADGNRFELSLLGNQVDSLNAGTIIFNRVSGTDGNDAINGGEGNDLLLGNAGNDKLNGSGGDDTLVGGAGKDTLNGGAGSDVFRFDDLLDSYRNYGEANIAAADTIQDFTVGVDKIDLSALGIVGLGNGYDHTVYMTLNDSGTKTSLKSREPDADGNTLEISLTGNFIGSLSEADFIFAEASPQNTLFVPTLGQSNARMLRMKMDDEQSGVTEMVKDLARYTDFDKVESLFFDANGNPVDIAVGGSTVTGRSTASEAEKAKAWWYSDTDAPGQALLNAVANLSSQLASLQAKGDVTMAIVWGQGEDDAMTYALAEDKQAAIELYKANTLKVFDYLKAQLGLPELNVYVMLTGNYQAEAADLRGYSAQEIADIVAGTQAIRQAQLEIAASRDDVKIAVDYSDLPMRYDVDPLLYYYYDVWHMPGDAGEIIGQRLADFIASDLGYPSDPCDNGDPDAISRYPVNHIAGSEQDDVLVGTAAGDLIDGGGGNDYMEGGEGGDVYIVDSAGDVIVENAANVVDVYDMVIASVDWSLGANLENLSLAGEARNGTGNNLRNIIGGNDHDNLLDGGAGVDALIGGKGNDSYIVDDAEDEVVEGSDAGHDQVFSYAAAYTLSANVEDLYLLAPHNANGTGNALDNVIYANAYDNAVNGGAGNDTLSYQFAEAGVTVRMTTSQAQATGGSGYDSLRNLENLIGSDYDDNLAGNAVANILKGGAGNDVLNGREGDDVLDGGAGSDSLTGGSGADRFVFGKLEDMGLGDLADLIRDFNAAEGDRIDLSALDANPLTEARDAFSFIGNESFSPCDATGQLRFADGVLYGSSNADSAAEFMIRLYGVNQLSQNDVMV
ncbi:calcium-binding protein [Pseudomonas sp. LRF_L74]|uniref:calcium-binding protein n=1 Tax=Pseudomonas sp. LRF_L74 TaxID=3369422 RepID=UPI003F5F4653